MSIEKLAEAMHDAAIRYANGHTVDFQHEAREFMLERDSQGGGGEAENAARYKLLRRKVCIVDGKFHILNLVPTYIGPDAAVELDVTIDAARASLDGRRES